MAHTFSPSTHEADLCEFEASMAYTASASTGSKATQRNPVSKSKNKTNQPTKTKQNKTKVMAAVAQHLL